MLNTPESVAHHEAGHAVAHVTHQVPFLYVTIRPRTKGAAGFVCTRREENANRGDDSDIITFLAGSFAQARLEWLKAGNSIDLESIELDYLRSDTSSVDWQSMGVPIDGSIENHIGATHDLVERRWTQIEMVAAALIERRTLTSREVRELCVGCDDRPHLSEHCLLTRAETRREMDRRMRERLEAVRARGGFPKVVIHKEGT